MLTSIVYTLQHKSATESDVRREFEGYGTIERVRIVRDKKGRSRGYAFVVYERERDMKGLFRFLFESSLGRLLACKSLFCYLGGHIFFHPFTSDVLTHLSSISRL